MSKRGKLIIEIRFRYQEGSTSAQLAKLKEHLGPAAPGKPSPPWHKSRMGLHGATTTFFENVGKDRGPVEDNQPFMHVLEDPE